MGQVEIAGEIKNTHKISVANPERKRQFVKSSAR